MPKLDTEDGPTKGWDISLTTRDSGLEETTADIEQGKPRCVDQHYNDEVNGEVVESVYETLV